MEEGRLGLGPHSRHFSTHFWWLAVYGAIPWRHGNGDEKEEEGQGRTGQYTCEKQWPAVEAAIDLSIV